MSEHETNEAPDERQDAQVEDLEMPPEESEDVKGGGKVNVQDLSFTKRADRSSP